MISPYELDYVVACSRHPKGTKTSNPEVKYEPEHQWPLHVATTQVIVGGNYGTRISVAHIHPEGKGGMEVCNLLFHAVFVFWAKNTFI